MHTPCKIKKTPIKEDTNKHWDSCTIVNERPFCLTFIMFYQASRQGSCHPSGKWSPSIKETLSGSGSHVIMEETPKAYDSKKCWRYDACNKLSHHRAIAKLRPILCKNCQRHPAAWQVYNHHKIRPKTLSGAYQTFKNPNETQVQVDGAVLGPFNVENQARRYLIMLPIHIRHGWQSVLQSEKLHFSVKDLGKTHLQK